jgi:hypothetical protein
VRSNCFPNIAAAPERASGALARRDTLLTGTRSGPGWLWRIRLEAVRRQVAATGGNRSWHLAAVIAGVWFCMDGAVAIIDRGAIFEARVMPPIVEAGLPAR